MSKRRMSLKDAAALVPDDLPDGAYWAMAHEMAGADYGEAWDELEDDSVDELEDDSVYEPPEKVPCPICGRKVTPGGLPQHTQAKHSKERP